MGRHYVAQHKTECVIGSRHYHAESVAWRERTASYLVKRAKDQSDVTHIIVLDLMRTPCGRGSLTMISLSLTEIGVCVPGE